MRDGFECARNVGLSNIDVVSALVHRCATASFTMPSSCGGRVKIYGPV